jgi:hypothetical protein
MGLRDLVTDVRTWWWRRERASRLIKDMADIRPGDTVVLTDDDRFALVERLVVLRERLDDDAADHGPVSAPISASALRRRPERLTEAMNLVTRQEQGCSTMQRVIEARGSLELSAEECGAVVAYWRWLEAHRRVNDD